MYYVMDCEEPMDDDELPLVEIEHYFQLGDHSWKTGRPFGQTIATPIAIAFERKHGYTGLPTELDDTGIPIMSERLGKELLACGVDNVEFYEAVLKDADSGQTIPYYAYNIVGLVEAADMGKSSWKSFDEKPVIDVSFESLTIDPMKTHHMPLFRLAENVNAIMVHQRVRDRLANQRFDMLTFTEPESWVQL